MSKGKDCTNSCGLNQNLDEVRGRIQGYKPPPGVKEAFSEVRKEESRKRVMLKSHLATQNMEVSALVVRDSQYQSSENRQKKERPWCEHCRKPGHVKGTCWKIHGKPADWKPSRQPYKEGRGNLSLLEEPTTTGESNVFSREQLDLLKKLLNQSPSSLQPSSTIGTESIAQKGNFATALNTMKKTDDSWIVDSGALDHMTGDKALFSTFTHSYENLTVRIADGSL